MEITLFIVCSCMLAVLVSSQGAKEGPCFDFHGDSYLHFTPNNFNNNNNIHYTLQFKTSEPNGVIMYARGLHGDDEALFIRNGKLGYHLFNTSPTGVEGYFGGYFEGDEQVSTGDWVKVHVYRSWQQWDGQQRRYRYQTGFVVEIGDQTYSHIDYRTRNDISLLSTVYFGGYSDPLSDTVGNFNGQIKDIREEKNGFLFEEPSLNYMSRVGLACLDPEVV